MFKSREEKNKEQECFEQQRKLEEELEAMKEEERRKREQEDFCKALDNDMTSNSVICIHTTNINKKQLALNHMINKGWICVQNDISCTYSTLHYVLTFADKEATNKFIAK